MSTRVCRCVVAYLFVVCLALLALPSSTARGSHVEPPQVETSPFRQIVIVAVNAAQNVGKPSLPERSLELAQAIRTRPIASDGHYYAPDVIIVNEIGSPQLTGLRNDLNDAFFEPSSVEGEQGGHYEIFGDSDLAKGKFLVNVESVDVSEAAHRRWPDDCLADRLYQLAWGLKERASGAGFSLAGVHFPTNYRKFLLPKDCLPRNVDRVRRELAAVPGPIVVGGDFNRRATETEGECDPGETNPPLLWWNRMTAFSETDSRTYVDSVQSWHRAQGLTLGEDWTHEQRRQSMLCNGGLGYRRSRIDYLFVSNEALVHEAHADHPGWAGPAPGTIACDPLHQYCKYSDHRFVWARLGI
jgi:hypothetical protein